MRRSIKMTLGFCFLMLTVASCRVEVTPNSLPTATELPDPHNHVVDVNRTGLSPESSADFAMVEVSLDPGLERENTTESPGGTFRAFTVCDPTFCSSENCCQGRILIEDTQTSQVYEIQGLPLRWRPFSDLVWITDDILVFDRWSNPDYGIHYAVNVRDKQLLLASPFPAQLPATP